MSIGTKKGTTYYCECKRMESIVNPILDNDTHMRYSGFFDEIKSNTNFDAIGGLKKTRVNKGVIFCNDASKIFGSDKGYVGLNLFFPYNIRDGKYQGLFSMGVNEYLLWGINVGKIDPTFPTAYAKLTFQGIEFTIWTQYAKYTIIDNSFVASENKSCFFEFLWDNEILDDFGLDDFDATMAIRINKSTTVIGNVPIATMDLNGANFCVLDSKSNYNNMECVLEKLVLGNEITTDFTT